MMMNPSRFNITNYDLDDNILTFSTLAQPLRRPPALNFLCSKQVLYLYRTRGVDGYLYHAMEAFRHGIITFAAF